MEEAAHSGALGTSLRHNGHCVPFRARRRMPGNSYDKAAAAHRASATDVGMVDRDLRPARRNRDRAIAGDRALAGNRLLLAPGRPPADVPRAVGPDGTRIVETPGDG